MSESNPVVVGRVLPRVSHVSVAAGWRIAVTWSDGRRKGTTDLVDLRPMLCAFRIYKPLRDDPAAFATVHVAAHGSAIAWGETEEIDISALAVEELAEQTMTSADFAVFLKQHALTFDMAAAQLGISRRQVAYYAGGRDIPRPVALACAYLDWKLPRHSDAEVRLARGRSAE